MSDKATEWVAEAVSQDKDNEFAAKDLTEPIQPVIPLTCPHCGWIWNYSPDPKKRKNPKNAEIPRVYATCSNCKNQVKIVNATK